jgi:8-oxo-dGTP diphosphatase
VREVLEEAGQHCRVVAPIGSTRYEVADGTKDVEWFAMRSLPDSPGFSPNYEVDQIRWLSRSKALGILSYEHDRDLVDGTDFTRLLQTGTLWLFRHAAAGDRSRWSDHDLKRALTKKGRRQAEAVAESLRGAGIERILTSPYDRCVQSVEALSRVTKAPIEVSEVLAEESDIDASYALVEELLGTNAVLCSHGDVIPALINRMMWAGLSPTSRFYCSKGSMWEVTVEGGKFTTGRYLPPPEV